MYILWIIVIIALGGLIKNIIMLVREQSAVTRRNVAGATGQAVLQTGQMQKQIAVFADAVKDIAGNMVEGINHVKEPDDVDISLVFNDISMKLCERCERCVECWETNFDNSYKDVCCILEQARSNGSIRLADVPEEFRVRCSFAEGYIGEVNRNFAYLRNESMWHSRAAEIKAAAAKQLSEVADQMLEIADGCNHKKYNQEQQKLLRKLMDEQIKVRDMNISEDSERLKVTFNAKSLNGRSIGAKKLLRYFEGVFGKRFSVADGTRKVIGGEYAEYIFCEDLNFKVLTGVARSARTENEISGDNYTFYEMKNGNMMMLLADGMGTGKKASEESKIVVEMMEELLEAGFGETAAMKIVNSTMMMRNDNFVFSTFDMGVINLFTGVLEIFKAGAAATFIKRRDRVEVIRSTSLPIGMINENAFDISRKKLYHSDYVIMVSDGVFDCIDAADKEEALYDMILKIDAKNPDEIANGILKEIRSSEYFKAKDDMTIMVAGIWQNFS